MGRKYDLVDVMAAIGLVATLFGGYLLVTAADGFWHAPSVSISVAAPSAVEVGNGMEYLQPTLGRAIVADARVDREAHQAISVAAAELNHAITEYQLSETTLMSPLVLAELTALGQEVDHGARVQYVMGKTIVNHTRRGIGSGILSADHYASDFNANLIRTAELTGQRMHDQFEAMRQPALGRSIVEAVQEEDRMTAAIQERLGRAFVQVIQAQDRYEAAKAAEQVQLASATVAALRSEGTMEAMASMESKPVEAMVVARHSTASPDVPRGFLILACMGLIILFIGGLALSSRKGEVDSIPLWKLETLLHLHRSAR
ncbi:hypothetical protein FBQ96_14175 [Nitrospirales bacterium NOB]|nr:MAG: hypothetical protein UZ03_NOB001002661 [Nitrospira sp. OLB3]MBV6471008.1 hypothetical protein [Nitrospirota bacterium]MCE7965740.1 hypothetical protein [Nitrospira sp. NTP2]MCK6493133.1 hypothetical protein [Nitrospira sp.]MDL1890697.1 hypothetical protein [Nitrospirales bacterium NOB]MEB2339871.1 hypothetical protein [Nitrospirales bacterium]